MGTNPEKEITKPLYHAAQIIKFDIKKCEGICVRSLNKHDLNLSKARKQIPNSLYALLYWAISSQEKVVNDYTTVPKSLNEADERRIIMIAQDILHSATHGRVRTPKHVSLGMSVRHIKGSKQLITLLNRMGHCSSYDEIETVDTALAREILAMTESYGVVIPTNISPGPFIHATCDNNDVNEETLDGKNTTHATLRVAWVERTVVLYQAGHFGPRPKMKVHGDQTVKRRALDSLSSLHEILDCSAQGKKPPVSCFLNKMNAHSWNNANTLIASAKKIDLTWSLLRSPNTVFEDSVVFRHPDQQRIPGWSGFNTETSDLTVPQTNVG